MALEIFKYPDEMFAFKPFFATPFKVLDKLQPRVAVDIHETEHEFIVDAEVPGFEKKEIFIQLDNNTLTIKGEKKQTEKFETNKVFTERSSFSSFSRSFTVPSAISQDEISAKLENGVLHIVLPKHQKEQPKIEIQ